MKKLFNIILALSMALTIFVMPNTIKANDQQIEPLAQTFTINVNDTVTSNIITLANGYIYIDVHAQGTVELTNYSVVSHNIKYTVSIFDGEGYYIENASVTTTSVTNNGLIVTIKATAEFDIVRYTDNVTTNYDYNVVVNFIC